MKTFKDLKFEDLQKVENSHLRRQFYYDFGNDRGINITKELTKKYRWSFKSKFLIFSDDKDYNNPENCFCAFKIHLMYLQKELVEIEVL